MDLVSSLENLSSARTTCRTELVIARTPDTRGCRNVIAALAGAKHTTTPRGRSSFEMSPDLQMSDAFVCHCYMYQKYVRFFNLVGDEGCDLCYTCTRKFDDECLIILDD